MSASDGISRNYHTPVMAPQTCDLLLCGDGKIFIDATLGGGGHTFRMLSLGARVIAIDQDGDAIKESTKRLAQFIESGKLEIVRGNFRFLTDLVRNSRMGRLGKIDGILLDLGISSHQIDEASRGFAFQSEGPLDMRMDNSGPMKATEIVNTWTLNEIANLLFNFGDEGNSRAIATEIVASRPMNTTKELRDAICRVTPSRFTQKTLARCFQAFRIFINDEMNALKSALIAANECLCEGGRLAVLSYHSLEDRQVKLAFQNKPSEVDVYNKEFKEGALYFTSPYSHQQYWKQVTKKAISPSNEEININSRCRSAKLRVAAKLSKMESHN